jgi:hypothetical protein
MDFSTRVRSYASCGREVRFCCSTEYCPTLLGYLVYSPPIDGL